MLRLLSLLKRLLLFQFVGSVFCPKKILQSEYPYELQMTSLSFFTKVSQQDKLLLIVVVSNLDITITTPVHHFRRFQEDCPFKIQKSE